MRNTGGALHITCEPHWQSITVWVSQPVLRINEARITTWIWFSIQWSQKGVRFLKSIQEVSDLIDCQQLDRNASDCADHVIIFPSWQLSTNFWQFVMFQGYEGSLLKVTSKNGKTASPVGFVTFASRASAEAAKQDLQVGRCCHTLPPPCHHCHHCLPPLALGRRHGSPPVAMETRRSGAGKSAIAAMFTTTDSSQSEAGSRGPGQSEARTLLLWSLLLLRPNISCHCASKLNNLILLKSICKYKHHTTHHYQIWSDLICASVLTLLWQSVNPELFLLS